MTPLVKETIIAHVWHANDNKGRTFAPTPDT